jgi:hypothetical protein
MGEGRLAAFAARLTEERDAEPTHLSIWLSE